MSIPIRAESGKGKMPPHNFAGVKPVILQRLKEETNELHHKLQDNSSFQGVGSPPISREQYTNLLKKFFGFYSAVEEKFTEVKELDSAQFDFDKRKKTSLIEKDLRNLGISEAEIKTLSICNELPELNTFGKALGCLYVLEGSTLGGQILSRNLATVGLGKDNGANFINCYGNEVGAMWKSFGEFLVTNSSKDNQEEIIKAAKETFSTLDKWLSS